VPVESVCLIQVQNLPAGQLFTQAVACAWLHCFRSQISGLGLTAGTPSAACTRADADFGGVSAAAVLGTKRASTSLGVSRKLVRHVS
jgi:hypothetical protein